MINTHPDRLHGPDAQTLAPLRPVARAEAIASLCWLVMLLLWWQGFNAALWQWFGWAPLPFDAAPIWNRVTPLVLVFIGGGLVRDAVALAAPHAVRFRALAGLLLNVVAVNTLFVLLTARQWVTVLPGHPAAVFERWINGGVWIALLVLSVIFVISAAHDTRRLAAIERH